MKNIFRFTCCLPLFYLLVPESFAGEQKKREEIYPYSASPAAYAPASGSYSAPPSYPAPTYPHPAYPAPAYPKAAYPAPAPYYAAPNLADTRSKFAGFRLGLQGGYLFSMETGGYLGHTEGKVNQPILSDVTIEYNWGKNLLFGLGLDVQWANFSRQLDINSLNFHNFLWSVVKFGPQATFFLQTGVAFNDFLLGVRAGLGGRDIRVVGGVNQLLVFVAEASVFGRWALHKNLDLELGYTYTFHGSSFYINRQNEVGGHAFDLDTKTHRLYAGVGIRF